MARPAATDLMQSMRFHVWAFDATSTPRLQFTPGEGDGRPQAGFSTCSTPELSVDAVEYREGTSVYARKYPGNPTVNDITLQRGLARGDTTFWSWLREVVEGKAMPGDYRCDLRIGHFHRVGALSKGMPLGGANTTNTQIDLSKKPAREYLIYQAFPIRHKVAGDFDSSSTEVSVMDLDVAYEYFEVVENE